MTKRRDVVRLLEAYGFHAEGGTKHERFRKNPFSGEKSSSSGKTVGNFLNAFTPSPAMKSSSSAPMTGTGLSFRPAIISASTDWSTVSVPPESSGTTSPPATFSSSGIPRRSPWTAATSAPSPSPPSSPASLLSFPSEKKVGKEKLGTCSPRVVAVGSFRRIVERGEGKGCRGEFLPAPRVKGRPGASREVSAGLSREGKARGAQETSGRFTAGRMDVRASRVFPRAGGAFFRSLQAASLSGAFPPLFGCPEAGAKKAGNSFKSPAAHGFVKSDRWLLLPVNLA